MKKRILSLMLSATMLLSTLSTVVSADVNLQTDKDTSNNDLRLWYDSPAEDSYSGWEKWSLPLGNGYMGASIFGGVEYERIQLNEKTLWSGGPSESRPDYNGGNIESNATVEVDGVDVPIMKAIQDAFARGDTETANSLCNKLTGVSDDAGTQGYGYFLSYGNMYLDFKDNIKFNNVKNYSRDLDLNTAISSVNYNYDNVNYKREYFISYPDNVMVTKLSASEKGKLSLDVRVEPDNTAGEGPNTNNGYTRTFTKTAKDGLITISGELDDNQMKFNSQTKVINSGGTITDLEDGKVNVKEADEVIIITSIATDYKNEYPNYRTGETDEELETRVNNRIVEASKKGYEGLLESHLSDYQGIFSRVDLDLGQTASGMTTDKLLSNYNNGTAAESEQRYLEVMLFQYGRYLSIASSRDGSLPSNLQGVWAGANNSPWHSDYHMNVNLQMNYWPSYSTNMAETALPLIDYVESLREPGRVTAEIYANIKSTDDNEENGFMAHTQNTPFGWTAPGWSFDWGWSPAAVPWILQNVWEYYEYTGDLEFMKTKIYPMLKEEAVLYEQMLIEDPETGKLVCSPAYSPEHGPRTNGNTYEQSLIWQMYEDVITAAKLVGEDQEKIEKWENIQKNLKGPIEIGDSGQIKEWYEETTLGSMGQKGHRHMSHLLGLFPGDLISIETPELLEAAIVSLNDRGDQSTGWAMGQRINTWARVGDGNRAYSLIRTLFKSGILTNLWDTHAPFQIDGNFGMTSGVAEMLMQSNMGYINFMAAMPDEWADGSVSGLVARGNFEIGMEWKDKQATKFTITSNNGGECIAKYENIGLSVVKDSKGNLVNYTALENEKISFDTVKGETYTITNIPTSKLDAPTNLNAYRTSDETVDLEWNAVEGKDITYNVYRQIDKGDLLLVGKNIESTSLIDENAQDILGTFKYSVSAVIDGNETKLSDSITVKDLRNMAGYIDDQDSRITYVGNWGNWSEGVNYAGTVKYLENPTGNETAELTFVGTGIEVIAVTNADRGKYEVFIDGVSKGEVDTYSSSTGRKKVIYTINDLEKGKHTIKLRATATKNPSASRAKVELDAFKVIDNTTSVVTSVDVASESGIYTLSKANSNLQMIANISPKDATNKEVEWKVTDKLGNSTNLATINENGLLTINTNNGDVRVTATSKENELIKDSVDIKIAIPGSISESIIEDAVNNNGWIKNPEYKWTGNWSTWAGEATKHHGGTKTETGTGAEAIGSSIEYTFSGTGIEVYVHKHTNFASFDISIDGGETTNYSLEGNDQGQAQLVSFKNLQNGEHTIKLIAKERSGKYQVNIDYFKVFLPEDNSSIDKNELQTSIENNKNKVEKDYTEETWRIFKEAYNNAVNTMNNDNANDQDIKLATKALNDAALALEEKPITTPPEIGDAKLEAIGVESSTLMLRWDSVSDAVKYNVYKINESTGEEILLDSITGLYYRVNELLPGTEYEFKVKAVNKNDIEAQLPSIKVTTKVALDKERPSDVKNLKASTNQIPTSIIKWDASIDNEGVKGYKIYLNGTLLGITENTNYELTGLEYGKSYIIMVIAFDEAGNTSLNPAVIEINENEKPTEVDKTELNKSITVAESLKREDYTEESWKKFSEILTEAKAILSKEDVTQEEINNIKSLLDKAIEDLKEVDNENPIEVDKTELNKLITMADALKKEDYTEESWKKFSEILTESKAILSKEDVTQEEINNIKSLLDKAIEDLKEVDSENPIEVDKTELNKLITMADALKKEDYTEESWKKFSEILTEAKVILSKEDVTQEEINNIKSLLYKAIEGLKEVDDENPVEVDKTQLKNLIIGAEALKKEDYTKESYEIFINILKEAKEILDKEDATQEEVDTVKNKLNKAINDLKANKNDINDGENKNNNGLPTTGGTSSTAIVLFGTIVSIIGVSMAKRKK
ncbi:glycosyl hydrolase family 95 catalytic domain-containing protein [Clostridium tertium]